MNARRIALALTLPLLGLAFTACSGPGGGFSIPSHTLAMGPRDSDGTQYGVWKYWYDYEHQHPKAQGEFKDDRQHGIWTYWHEGDAMEWQGSFADRRLSGLSMFWYPNGTLRARGLHRGGLEEGPWTWWTQAGEVDQQGELSAGKPTSRWSYCHPDGSLSADGFRWNGERVGLWRFWSASGDLTEKSWPMPDGWSLVCEEWEDGTPRRDGMLERGRPVGRWATWHRNGERRISGEFKDGQASGEWIAWRESGDPLAAGPVKDGRAVGEWKVWVDGRPKAIAAAKFGAARAVEGAWSADDAASAAPIESIVPTWIAEACSPVSADGGARKSRGASEPDAATIAQTDRRPRIPIRAQPWTQSEQENLDYLVDRYTHGTKSAKAPVGSKYKRPGPRTVEPKGDVKHASQYLGKPLPQTLFTTGEGEQVDLASYKGKRLVVVILRGYAGMVCVYCATQTKALAGAAEAFAKENAEVLVVYPGPEDGLPAFIEAYKTLSNGIEPPYKQLADADFRLVDPLGLRGDLAIPATLVLDESGIVRWAYVGQKPDDRPSTDEIVKALQDLGGP